MIARAWTRRYARVLQRQDRPLDRCGQAGQRGVRGRPGPRYRLRDVAIEVTPPDADLPLPSLAELGIAPGTPAVAQTILDAETRLVERAKARGYALAEAGERRAWSPRRRCHGSHAELNAGPPVRFGDIEVTGLDQVQPDFVERRLPWQPGS